MALTDVAIRKAKPDPKPVKLADGGAMHLLITPAGGKLGYSQPELRWSKLAVHPVV